MPKFFSALVLGVSLLVGSGLAQPKSLTNADVVKMVKAGLGTEIIVASIGASDPQFDVSPDALIALKRDGVPDGVLQAMVARSQPSARPTQGPAVQPAQPASPFSLPSLAASGIGLEVALVDGSTRVQLRRAMQGGRTSGVPLPFARHNMIATFKEGRAEIRSHTGSASFQFVLPADRQPRDVLLVKFDAKKDRREIKTGGGHINVSVEFDKDDLIPTTITEVTGNAATNAGGKVYAMNPVKPLRPGEYAVVFDMTFYDFGVN